MNQPYSILRLFSIPAIIFLVFTMASCLGEKADPNFTEGQKSINNAGIFCKVSGSGEPVIVVHGGPGLSHDYLYPHLKGLAQNHKLIFYDQRACGRSSVKVDTNSMNLETFIKDIDAIRAAFGYEKIHLLAHSWGGLLAMKYAIRYPDRLQSLTLVNSVGASNQYAARMNQLIASRFSREDSVRRTEIVQTPNILDSLHLVNELMLLGFKPQFFNPELTGELQLALNENLKTTSSLLQRLSKDLDKYNFIGDLKRIKTPTLLLYGDFDPLTDMVGKNLKSSIPGASLLVIDNCGHFPFIEKKEAFNNAIRQFWGKYPMVSD